MGTYSLSATLMTHSLRYWFIGILLITTPLFARADLLSDLQAQVQALLAQIATLQAQQGAAPSQTSVTSTTTPSGRPVACPVLFNVAMRFQDRDNPGVRNVRELQIFLATHYGIPREDIVTGYFGKATESRVKRFQRENGIEETGIVGTQTRNAIQRVCGRSLIPSTTPASPEVDLKVNGSDGPINVTNRESIQVTWTSQNASGCFVSGNYTGSETGTNDMQPSSGVRTLVTELRSEPYYTNKIHITCNIAGENRSVSDEVVLASGGSSAITVTAPNGGEQWEIGKLNTITWQPYSYNPDVNPAKDVVVYLVGERGERVGRVMDTGKASLHTYLNIDSNLKWATPGRYYVEAVNMVTGARDRSDAPFTILPRAIDLKINGSDGPVNASDNQPVSISWKIGSPYQTMDRGCTLSGVRSAPGGGIGPIKLGTTSGSGTYYAYAPTPGAYTAVHISCIDGAKGLNHTDVVGVISPEGVATSSSLRVASPNGGEQISIGQPHEIIWKQVGLSKVSIALYSFDQWKDWIVRDLSLDKDPADTYSYMWTPSPTDTGRASFKIYITGLKADGSGYVDDKSDAPFSFTSSGSGSTDETPTARLIEAPVPTVSSEGTIQFTMNVEVENPGSEDIYVPLSSAVTSSGGSGEAGAVFMIYDGANNNVTSLVSSAFTRLSGGTETGNTVRIAPGSSARFQLSAVMNPSDTSQHFLQLALIGWGETENMTPTKFISPSNFRTPSAALSTETSSSPLACTLNGATVAHGATKRFWERRYSDTCGQIFQDRTCRNGVLSGNAKYDKALCTKPVGVYRGYMNGALFISTRDITEAEALTNCKRNANDNPSKTVTCTWEGKTIYPVTTSSAAPSSFLAQVDASSQTASAAALSELLQQLSTVLNQMVAALGN